MYRVDDIRKYIGVMHSRVEDVRKFVKRYAHNTAQQGGMITV